MTWISTIFSKNSINPRVTDSSKFEYTSDFIWEEMVQETQWMAPFVILVGHYLGPHWAHISMFQSLERIIPEIRLQRKESQLEVNLNFLKLNRISFKFNIFKIILFGVENEEMSLQIRDVVERFVINTRSWEKYLLLQCRCSEKYKLQLLVNIHIF